jgi:hypothetical protein
MTPPQSALYDLKVDNPHVAYYLRRPVMLIESFPPKGLQDGAVIYIDVEDEKDFDMKDLILLGRVKARRDELSLDKVRTGN